MPSRDRTLRVVLCTTPRATPQLVLEIEFLGEGKTVTWLRRGGTVRVHVTGGGRAGEKPSHRSIGRFSARKNPLEAAVLAGPLDLLRKQAEHLASLRGGSLMTRRHLSLFLASFSCGPPGNLRSVPVSLTTAGGAPTGFGPDVCSRKRVEGGFIDGSASAGLSRHVFEVP